jgi:hypothetical protein
MVSLATVVASASLLGSVSAWSFPVHSQIMFAAMELMKPATKQALVGYLDPSLPFQGSFGESAGWPDWAKQRGNGFEDTHVWHIVNGQDRVRTHLCDSIIFTHVDDSCPASFGLLD